MKHITHTSKIWTIDNFLSPSECEDLITFSESTGYEEAVVKEPADVKLFKGLRNNYRLVYDDVRLAEKLWYRLYEFCPQEIENAMAAGLNEQFKFYKYESDQQFKKHVDRRVIRNYQESRITFMVYLNDGFEGGETNFEGVSIKPKTGTALYYIHELQHEGCPVTGGTKYVLSSDVMYKNN